jgi:hypothetical protein
VTIDELSFSHLDPSSGDSTVSMIDNPQPGTVNLGVGLFLSLMRTFDYPRPSNDVKIISVVLDQPKAAILQVSSFRASYFHDSWNLPSSSALMEGIGNLGMAIPLSMTEVAYNIIQQASTNPDPAPSQELDPVLEPVWAQDPLELVLPSNEVILEAMKGPYRP